MPDHAPTHHATALLWGAHAVLLRGAAGSGKSRLALELLAEGARRGVRVALIGDDRVVLQAASGRLIARAAAPLAGRIEVRGIGILGLDHEPAGVVGLVVDFVREQPDRLPDVEAGDLTATIAGVRLPRLALWIQDSAPLARLLVALDTFDLGDASLRQNPSKFHFVT